MSGTIKCGPSWVNNPRQLVKLEGSLISSKAVLNLHNITMNVKSVTTNIVANGINNRNFHKILKIHVFPTNFTSTMDETDAVPYL